MNPEMAAPIALFNFHVEFDLVKLGEAKSSGTPDICFGSFAECTGLEATMEPKVIKSGGANYGAAQRVGPVTFGTVVLKRGLTTNRDLWKSFAAVTERALGVIRFNVKITVLGPGGETAFTVSLARALPVKFKCGDLNARATEVGIEELHLAHEGLSLN